MEITSFPSHPVLIVDDEARAIQSIAALLRTGGINHVMRCEDSREVLGILERETIEVLLLDLRMPHQSGEDLLPKLLENHPEVPIIVVTGLNDLDAAVRFMRLGAFDYMVKPVEEQRLISGVRRAIEVRELRSEYSFLRARLLSEELQHPEAFANFLTNSPKIHAVFRYAETVSVSPRPVLITGETGVGKELIARALHTLSGRSGRFVAVNVAGVDDTVFSDTLFGHVPGAFTGAEAPRPGLLEQAAGGTLFLDEIGDLKNDSQVKLLRLLQEREYFPLGADLPKPADVRVVVATHEDLDALVQSGAFRRDLYYRLQIHRIHIPPLRERLEDLPLLIDHFLKQAAAALRKSPSAPSRELIALLQTHAFPGNVRELEAMIYDAISRQQAKALSLEHFKNILLKERRLAVPATGGQASAATLLSLSPTQFPTLAQAADLLVAEALRRSNGNQTLAARLLGITPSALNKRLKRAQRKVIS